MRTETNVQGSMNHFETFFAAVASMAANPSLPPESFRKYVLDLCQATQTGSASQASLAETPESTEAFRVKVRLNTLAEDQTVQSISTTLHFSHEFFSKLVKHAGSESTARAWIREEAANLPADTPRRFRSETVRNELQSKMLSRRINASPSKATQASLA